MKISIFPSENKLDHWIANYVPEKDIYFLLEEHISLFLDNLEDVLIIPIKEFFENSTYQSIEYNNSFEYFNISKKAEIVIIAHYNWFSSLPQSQKEILTNIQIQMNRGLISKRYGILTRKLWDGLDSNTKRDILKTEVKEWDDLECYKFKYNFPSHLGEFANSFPNGSGGNCLSAVLFAITKQKWIINEWVHKLTFYNGLQRAGYEKFRGYYLKPYDVVVWENISHASYHIEDNLFFNKDGQNFFNPWKITDFEYLKKEWGNNFEIYRK